MSFSSEENIFLTQGEELNQVSNADFTILPDKSREKYLKAYDLFNDWRLSKGAKTYSETMLLSYFMELSETRQPNTLWSIFSMLKAVIKSKHDVNIERYTKLMAFLKEKSKGYKPKKSKVFTASEINKFLNEAPDLDFLGIKVVLIIGINGGCRSNELLNLTVSDIKKHSDKLILVKPHKKKKLDMSFVIRDEYVNYIDRYMALRPAYTKTNRFFLQYHNGKCKKQPMGINKIGEIPRKIATFLELDNPHLYTGHCLRRTSATLLADSGVDFAVLKCRKSSTSVEDIIESKSTIRKSFIEPISLKTHTDISHPSTSREVIENPVGSPIEFHSQCPNVKIEINNDIDDGADTPSADFHRQYTNVKKEINDIKDRGASPSSEFRPQCANIKTDAQVNNITISFPNKTVTLNLNNGSNLTFNFQ